MESFKGTGRLILLALRRDRIKLTIWAVAIIGTMAAAVPAIKEVYGANQMELNQYAVTTASSMVGRMLGGPIDGPQLGSVIMLEYFLFVAVLIAFMSSLAIVRHTRQNEEAGRSELIGSAPVGRNAMLSAALAVVVGLNVLVAICLALVLSANGLSTEGSVAMAIGLGGVGVVFAGVGAVSAQIIGTARGANAVAGAIIGAAILVRGVGDSLGKTAEDGMSVASNWLSWLSPVGWGQQMHPFVTIDWSPVYLYLVSLVVLVIVAFWLASHRDHGMGMIAARSGRAHAKASLLSSLGLAWRLQRGVVISWTIGVAVLGALLGLTAVEFKDLFMENEQVAAMLQAMGRDAGSLTDVYFAAMMGMMGFVMAGFSLQAILRLQTEESNGYLEGVLSTGVSRLKWAMSHLTIVIVGLAVMGAVAGLSTGISYALVAENAWGEIGGLVIAGFVQIPAILTLVALAVLVFGLLPRLMTPIVWGVFAACLVIFQLGSILKLPEWLIDISPFTHTPVAPADSIEGWPLLVMSVIAIALCSIGLALFRRRDSVA
ncbi:MAG TPA: hypothetical protein VFZ62_04170 [Candidatus Saccharimonadales bacterium]